ncbi:MAG: hypothetical protein K6E59_02960, partial [Bacilli bacterium]|nr:hypothetical protein [Bacilli bacterium]
VLDLSREVLRHFGGAKGLTEAGFAELRSLKGIGKGKACMLLALGELLRRYGKDGGNKGLNSIFESFRDDFPLTEEAYVYALDRKERVLSSRLVGRGSRSALKLDPSEVLRSALATRGERFLFLHVHPSGNAYPSYEDIDMTNRLCVDAKRVSLSLFDHIILTPESRFSFKENGLLLEE